MRLLREKPIDSLSDELLDYVLGLVAVDFDHHILVEALHRRHILMELHKTSSQCLFRIVTALVDTSRDLPRGRREELHVVALARDGINAATRDSLYKNLVRHVQEDESTRVEPKFPVKCRWSGTVCRSVSWLSRRWKAKPNPDGSHTFSTVHPSIHPSIHLRTALPRPWASYGNPKLKQNAPQHPRLRHGPRHPVEEISLIRRDLLGGRLDDAHHEVVRHQIALVHEGFGLHAQVGLRLDLRAQGVARADVLHVVAQRDRFALRALARRRRTRDDEAQLLPSTPEQDP
eukprot:scaffold831_cov268-Pinguiococcus_pyrenoidosus.AAC.13